MKNLVHIFFFLVFFKKIKAPHAYKILIDMKTLQHHKGEIIFCAWATQFRACGKSRDLFFYCITKFPLIYSILKVVAI